MFTGIIEEIGKIVEISKKGGGIFLQVSGPKSVQELKVNDSVAINGVCQTVLSKKGDSFVVEAVEETLKKTTFSSLKIGASVNLELPMRLNERLGGHLVLGHVDCIGTISHIDKRKNSWMFTIEFPEKYTKYVIPIGSIAIDGVSLTIAELDGNQLRVSIIPHTMENTIFKSYNVNNNVNLEFDIIGKYIERMHGESNPQFNQNKMLSESGLKEAGY